jgi:hypothetical protein
MARAKTMSEDPDCPSGAQHTVSRVALVGVLVDEGLLLRRDAVDRAWFDWLTDSTPGIGPPESLRGAGIGEGMRATA